LKKNAERQTIVHKALHEKAVTNAT